ncbi:hypothetical protein [Taibaiella koreensis]|uniref:hypothetical protein n=1 Tax=Taibaiella koreensis TaxID=1268548 RepID=UPI000E59DA05|nr:hypothetical protein [Taibaiella koreensis]
MKKRKLDLNKKLSLQKEKITDMKSVSGGQEESIFKLTIVVVDSAINCTRAKGCDLPTYSHDDGSFCVSASRVGCDCSGR